mgnify:CR=1 FL=1
MVIGKNKDLISIFAGSRKSEIITLTPILLGLVVGFVAAMMGIGGAFLMVPAMIYIVGMPIKLIPGTSLFVTIFISAIVTLSLIHI